MGDIFDAIRDFDVKRVSDLMTAEEGEPNLLLTKTVSSLLDNEAGVGAVWSKSTVNPLCHPFLWIETYSNRDADRSAIIGLLLESDQYRDANLLQSWAFRVRTTSNEDERELQDDFDDDEDEDGLRVVSTGSLLEGCLANFNNPDNNDPYLKIAQVLFSRGVRIREEDIMSVCSIFFGRLANRQHLDPHCAWFTLFCHYGFRFDFASIGNNEYISAMEQIQHDRIDEVNRAIGTTVVLCTVARRNKFDKELMRVIVNKIFDDEFIV
jgi:hypothetical protein